MSAVLFREVAALALLAAAAAWDCRTRRIPNFLTFAALAAGAALAWHVGGEARSLAVAGFWIGLGVPLLLYLGRGLGGGDVKLMAALGLLCGYPDIVHLLFYGTLAAAMLALAGLAWEGRLRAGLHIAFSRKPPGEGQERPTARFALAQLIGFVGFQLLKYG